MARAAARRSGGRVVRGNRHRPAGGAAAGRARDARGGRPRCRPARCAGRRAATAGGRPIRPGSVSPDNSCWRSTAAAGRWRRSRNTAALARRSSRRSAWSRGRSCAACTKRSCARIPRSSHRLPRPELPRELDAAAAPRLVGRDAELGWLRERWEGAKRGTGSLVTMTGRARDRQKPAGRRAGRRRPSPRGHGAVRGRGRSRRRRPGRAELRMRGNTPDAAGRR